MAEIDAEDLQQSLDEIKHLLSNKRKKDGEAVTSEIFTDPRFIELFENYFKPLVESSKDIKGKLTEKKKISVFDVMGLSDRKQDQKRDALTKEFDKITEKLRNIGKSLGNARYYSLSDVIGLTKNERATNRRIINNSVRTLSLSLKQTAKNLSDPNVIMKFLGVKPIAIAKVVPSKGKQASVPVTTAVQPPIATRTPTTATPAVSSNPITQTPAPTPAVKSSLAERREAEGKVVPVKLVGVSEEIGNLLKKLGKGRAAKEEAQKGEHESYSHGMNAIARLLTLGGMFLTTGLVAIFSGMFDSGPLKGLKKVVGIASLKIATAMGKGIVKWLGNLVPSAMKVIGGAFKSTSTVIKRGLLKMVGVRAFKWLSKGLKKMPVIGALISIGFAADRFRKGDIQGGLIELASGAASTIPVIGTAVSIGLDLVNASADIQSGGVTPNKKGWLGKLNKWIADKFKSVLRFHLNMLPFGLGKKVAGWMGFSLDGLNDDSEDPEFKDTADRANNRAMESGKIKIEDGKKSRDRAMASRNARADKALKEGRQYNQYTEAEKIADERDKAWVARADKQISDGEAIIRDPSKLAAAYKQSYDQATKKAEDAQKAATGEDTEDTNEQQEESRAIDTPPVSVNRAYEPDNSVVPAPQSTATVDELKKLNNNFEQMTAKAAQPQKIQQGNDVVNIMQPGGGGSGGVSPIQLILDATRDTCYTSRERTRNIVLDNRQFA